MTDFPCLVTHTRSRAWNLGHGEPVVLVDGYPGGISLEHIDPRHEPPATTGLQKCDATPDNPRKTREPR